MRKLNILLYILSISATATFAQTNGNSGTLGNDYTLEVYRKSVMDYSMQLKQAKESVMQAEFGIKAVKTGMLPQISGAVDFSYLMKKIEFDLGGSKMGFKPYNYGATITAAQNIYSGGVVNKKSKIAEMNADVSSSAEVLTIDNIIYNADYVYWSTAAVNAYLTVTSEYLTVLKDTYKLVKERFDNGLISKNDLLLIETRVSEAELGKSQMESNYINTHIAFNMLMGKAPNFKSQIYNSVTSDSLKLPIEVNLDEVIKSRPEYLIASKQLEISKMELSVTKSDYLPQLAIGVTGQYQTQSLNIDGKAIGNGVAFAQLKVPIFGGNSRKFRTSIDRSKIRSSEYELTNIKDQIVQDVTTSWSTLNESIKQVEIAKRNMDIASQSLKLNSYSFSQGLLSILDLMQSQLSWYGAYNSIIQANYNYKVALSQYNKAIGAYDRF